MILNIDLIEKPDSKMYFYFTSVFSVSIILKHSRPHIYKLKEVPRSLSLVDYDLSNQH